MDNAIDQKWNKLLRRAGLFTFIPFVEIVFTAGSMAMGNAGEDSDFDFIIGVKSGRIFTVRFFCWLFFGILGWRRKRGVEGRNAKDKFCFSHFVAPEKYAFSPPYDNYSQKLFSSLVPIYGDKEKIQKFYDANAFWMDEKRAYKKDARHIYEAPGPFKVFLESVFGSKLGDVLEKWLKIAQIKKIEKSLKTEKHCRPRIIFNDSELEFHPVCKSI
jgi:hypothetical protein